MATLKKYVYLYVLDHHGVVGEVSDLSRVLQNLEHHVAPLSEHQQRVLQDVPQPRLGL